jgi:hypothetical protein
LSFQSSTPRDVNLKFDQIEPRGALRYGVFDLQSRIHLHEGKAFGLGLVQELYRAGVVIAGGLAEPHGCFAKGTILS